MATAWPDLVYSEWGDTCETVHMWTHVVGKIRMAKTPPVNHWWHVPLYLTSRGLGTSPIPDETRTFDIDLDWIDHRLTIATSDGAKRDFKLRKMSVAEFYERIMTALRELGIDVEINTTPQEVADPIPFEHDTKHFAYDEEAVSRFWRVLVLACQVLTRFRSEFIGKVSPVHFFWGSFDLAVTRFSGRIAPEHPGAPGIPDSVTREAYSHEVSSAGYWPGGNGADAAFYSYAYPEPVGYKDWAIQPGGGTYSAEMREFLLPYRAIREVASPDEDLLTFFRSTYDGAATFGNWPRQALERSFSR